MFKKVQFSCVRLQRTVQTIENLKLDGIRSNHFLKITLLWNQGYLGVGWEKVEKGLEESISLDNLRRESEGQGEAPSYSLG